MIHPRALAVDEPRPPVPQWWCSRCRERVDGPWHEAECPNEDREVGG